MLVLYIILGLCTLAVVGVAGFGYRRIRRHLTAVRPLRDAGVNVEPGE